MSDYLQANILWWNKKTPSILYFSGSY